MGVPLLYTFKAQLKVFTISFLTRGSARSSLKEESTFSPQKSGIGKGEGNERFDRGVAAAGRSSGVMGDETAGLSSFGVELDATVAFLVGVHISGLEFASCS